MTYREVVYMILDEIKSLGGDQTFNENHVIFLLGKYRAYLLETKLQQQGESSLSESNYQTVCLTLEQTNAIDGLNYCNATYLRSKEVLSDILAGSTIKVTTPDQFAKNICFVTPNCFKFKGNNKYMRGIIYCTLGKDKRLYFKGSSPQFLYMESAKAEAIFEDDEAAAELTCDGTDASACDVLDREFPLEADLIPACIDAVVKELYAAQYRPEDKENNDNDDIADLVRFMRTNTKSDLAKQITN